MKKIFAILLGAVILMTAAACADEKKNETTGNEVVESAVTSEETEDTSDVADETQSETEAEEAVEEETAEEDAETTAEEDEASDDAKEETAVTEEKAEESVKDEAQEKEPTVVELPKEDKVIKEVLPVTGYDATKMMDSIMSVFPGSSGSSLRTYIAAFEVLNLSERYNDGDKQAVEEALAMHVAALPDFSIDNMKETVAEIDTIASKVFSDGVEALSAELSDVGNPNEYDSYSKANYDKVIKLIKTALGM